MAITKAKKIQAAREAYNAALRAARQAHVAAIRATYEVYDDAAIRAAAEAYYAALQLINAPAGSASAARAPDGGRQR